MFYCKPYLTSVICKHSTSRCFCMKVKAKPEQNIQQRQLNSCFNANLSLDSWFTYMFPVMMHWWVGSLRRGTTWTKQNQGRGLKHETGLSPPLHYCCKAVLLLRSVIIVCPVFPTRRFARFVLDSSDFLQLGQSYPLGLPFVLCDTWRRHWCGPFPFDVLGRKLNLGIRMYQFLIIASNIVLIYIYIFYL